MKTTLFIFLLLKCLAVIGQTSTNVSITLPPVSLVDVVPAASGNVVLSMTAPVEAGTIVGSATPSANTWLIFTSAVQPGVTRSIKGDIIGTLPAGIKLRLNVAAYAGTGQGFTAGSSTVTSSIYLTNLATTFISNIRGAYTGTGAGEGFKLTYSLEIDSYDKIRSGTSQVTVRYTMVDN